MRANRADPNPDAGDNLRVRPPGGLMGRVCIMATHMGITRGPVIGGWRAACMPPLHCPTSTVRARSRAPASGRVV